MLTGMLIWYSGVILNLFFCGKVSAMKVVYAKVLISLEGCAWVVEGQM